MTAEGSQPARRPVRLVLASASPSRLATLRGAGIEPTVVVSGVDEDSVEELRPDRLAGVLATLKARAVVSALPPPAADERVLVVGCDSVFELDGSPYGKPGSPDVAARRLAGMQGSCGVLHTGHHLVELGTGDEASEVASTTVCFGPMSDEEIAAYVDTGEPLQVAGSFTMEGYGGAFVERVDGDPSNVIGLSLPLLRRLAATLDVFWPDLWNRPAASGASAGG